MYSPRVVNTVHKIVPPDCPGHIVTQFLKDPINFILPCTPKFYRLPLSFRLSEQNLVFILHLFHSCFDYSNAV
jgi:hypothetical protein